MAWQEFPYFKPSTPLAATGGIKAQSKQGGFGKNWWAKRWIAVLEGLHLGPRLTRGRSYARRGQVLDIQVEPGCITAKVQGSRPRPYFVEIKVKPLSKAEQASLGKALAEQALFTAKLLAGEMPQDIEQAFASAGLSLFPKHLDDLVTGCSCPDWSNPCKHIAAAYYLVGEEFHRDPFLIFKLRGVDRDKLTTCLGAGANTRSTRPTGTASSARNPTPIEEPIDSSAARFWEGSELPPGWLGEVRVPPMQAPLLRRLGNFPFWRGNERFADALIPVYARACDFAEEVLMGVHK
jgi:uncharacterized Zn finger protein